MKPITKPQNDNQKPPAHLKRSLNLPLLILYGLGTTIGAGIYVLVGAAAGRAGLYAPLAFLLAAIGLAPTAAAYAEFVSRYPVSAGEAAYVRAGFKLPIVALITGWLVIISGIVASATIAIGSAGYIRIFLDIPMPIILIVIIALVGLIATWGILESVMLAALFTLVEAGGLIALIIFGLSGPASLVPRLPEIIPPINDLAIWGGIASASLLTIFAFIGFEDMVNVAEETKNPKKTLPWAIFWTLLLTTLLYVLVTAVAVLAVPPEELAASEAPLSLVFAKVSGRSPMIISAIAIFATLNTILIQFIMASRVIYGMAGQGTMPAIFSRISARTHTPIYATLAVIIVTLVLALTLPLEQLAEFTSHFLLIIWLLVNAALIRVKLRGDPAPEGAFIVPLWVPFLGLGFSIIFTVTALI